MSAADLRATLDRLLDEQREAAASPLRDNRLYMADLEEELAAARHAYVGLAVTEIAALRARLSAPLLG